MGAVSIGNGDHYVWGDGCDGWHLLKSAGLSVIQERVPPGKAETLHRHHRATQFFYVLAGVATLVLAGEAITLTPARACMCRPACRINSPTRPPTRWSF